MQNKLLIGLVTSALIITAVYIYFTKMFTDFGTSVFAFSVSLASILFILLFLKEKILHSWLKFAAGWLILSLILILISPDYRPASGFVFSGFDKELTAQSMATLFFVISLVIIGVQSLRLRNK